MTELAIKDPLVKEQFTQERKVQVAADFSEKEDWQSRLELEKNGKIKDTLINLLSISSCGSGGSALGINAE